MLVKPGRVRWHGCRRQPAPEVAGVSVTAPQLSPNIRISGYVYNTAAGTLDTVIGPTPVGKR